MSKEKKDSRVRNWAFIQYDDSAPEDWLEILKSTKIPFVVSPLHNEDVNPDGTPKKPHRHIILANSGKKSYDQMMEISNKISGCKVEPVSNMRGYIRYLAHMDNPEKFQYDPSLIKSYNGFQAEVYLKMSTSDIREILKDIFTYIRDNDIQSYSDFIDMCIFNDLNEWFEVATMKHTVSIKEYIKSYTYKHVLLGDDGKPITDENGCVIYVGEYLKRFSR